MTPKELERYLKAHRQEVSQHGGFIGLTVNRDARAVEARLQPESLKARLASLPKGARVLEVGIGKGAALEELRGLFPHLKFFGTNFFERYKSPSRTRGVVNAEASELPFNNNSFDLVYSVQTAHYVPNKARFLEETHRVLKKGGTALIDLEPSLFLVSGKGELHNYFVLHKEIQVHKPPPGGTAHLIRITKRKPSLKLPLKLSLEKSECMSRGPVMQFKSTYNEVKLNEQT